MENGIIVALLAGAVMYGVQIWINNNSPEFVDSLGIELTLALVASLGAFIAIWATDTRSVSLDGDDSGMDGGIL